MNGLHATVLTGAVNTAQTRCWGRRIVSAGSISIYDEGQQTAKELQVADDTRDIHTYMSATAVQAVRWLGWLVAWGGWGWLAGDCGVVVSCDLCLCVRAAARLCMAVRVFKRAVSNPPSAFEAQFCCRATRLALGILSRRAPSLRATKYSEYILSRASKPPQRVPAERLQTTPKLRPSSLNVVVLDKQDADWDPNRLKQIHKQEWYAAHAHVCLLNAI
jgi:hypothetical protein